MTYIKPRVHLYSSVAPSKHLVQSPMFHEKATERPTHVYPRRDIVLRLIICAILLIVFCSDSASAQRVRPNEVAVVAAKGNAESIELAEYYCRQRGIDSSRILQLPFPEGDELDRQFWEEQTRPEIQRWLELNDADQQITHLVTTFGVPLAVSAWNDKAKNPDVTKWSSFYDALLEQHLDSLNKSVGQVAKLAKANFEPFSVELATREMGKQFDDLASLAQQAIAALPPENRGAANESLQSDVRDVAGLLPFINGIKSRVDSGQGVSQGMMAKFERALGLREGFEKSLATIERTPVNIDREIMIARVLKLNSGDLAVIQWIRQQAELIDLNRSMASFDSELCLVRISDYRRAGEYPLPKAAASNLPGKETVLSVTRIDGPNVDSAKVLIDRATALAGPEFKYAGKVYIDKRGLPESARPSDLKIEYWLETMAARFAADSELEVIKDERPVLFEEGKCPDTALYLGWYGLGNFRDSFTFTPGATAYHLVPFDALDVHDPEDTGWCKNLIEKGATFVVGSVTEPMAIKLIRSDESTGILIPQRSNASDGSVIFGDFLYVTP